jgi:hypothetical protein
LSDGNAGFDPDRAGAVEAVQRTSAQVLLIDGANGWFVPQEHSIRLARDHSELVSIPWHGHVAVWFDPTGEVGVYARAWFDRWLGNPNVATARVGALANQWAIRR